MEKRRFGRSGHLSTVAIFGASAFWTVTQNQANAVMRTVIDAGINHIDVAPSYGEAEERLGPILEKERDRFFLCCKTMERTKDSAMEEMKQSMKRLRISQFDDYQLHAVTSMDELDKATSIGGALEAIKEARQGGLTRFIGITAHGYHAPTVFIEALRRFPFDSVLFAMNYVQFSDPIYRKSVEELLRICRNEDVGVMVIKSIAKAPWENRIKTYDYWFEPFTEPAEIQKAVNFCLSQDITGVITIGNIPLLPKVIQACENFSPLDINEQEKLITNVAGWKPFYD